MDTWILVSASHIIVLPCFENELDRHRNKREDNRTGSSQSIATKRLLYRNEEKIRRSSDPLLVLEKKGTRYLLSSLGKEDEFNTLYSNRIEPHERDSLM
jgi:hypothetical protein